MINMRLARNTKYTMLLLGPQGPNAGAEGMVTNKFVSMMRKNGWRVIWLFQGSSDNNHSDIKDDSDFIAISSLNSKLRANFFSKIASIFNNPFLNSLGWCLDAYFEAKRIIKNEHIDLISSRIMPKYGHLSALYISRKYDLLWHANWSDPLPQYMAPTPYGKGTKAPMSKFDRWYLANICKQATFHTFPSERLLKHYLRYVPASANRCYILPHIAESHKKSSPYSEHILTMTYVGGGLKQRDPELFFQALSQVRAKLKIENITIEIKFVGSIEEQVLAACIRQNVKDFVTFIGSVSYEASLNYIQKADINLVIEAPMKEGIFLPSKLADIVSCGKPMFVVSPQEGVLHDLISKYGGGIFTNNQSVESIKAGLITLIDDWKNHRLNSPKYQTQELYQLFSMNTVWKRFSAIINKYLPI